MFKGFRMWVTISVSASVHTLPKMRLCSNKIKSQIMGCLAQYELTSSRIRRQNGLIPGKLKSADYVAYSVYSGALHVMVKPKQDFIGRSRINE